MNMKNKIYLQGDAGGPAGGGGEPAPSGEAGLTHGAQAFEPATKTTTGEPPLP